MRRGGEGKYARSVGQNSGMLSSTILLSDLVVARLPHPPPVNGLLPRPPPIVQLILVADYFFAAA
eukprot:91318-Pyramimonas_sp.AAC.1